jgi:hypothetical protein
MFIDTDRMQFYIIYYNLDNMIMCTHKVCKIAL